MISRADTGSANVNPKAVQACAILRSQIQNCVVAQSDFGLLLNPTAGLEPSTERSGGRSCSSAPTSPIDAAAQRATVHLLTGLDGERVQNGFTKNRIREMSNT
jgi:hypothetical protein